MVLSLSPPRRKATDSPGVHPGSVSGDAGCHPVGMPTKRPGVTQEETVHALLERSKRDELPIRKEFLQQGSGRVRQPGPLAELCRRQDERALDLYLLFHAAASADPYDVVLAAGVWARALGLSWESASARSAVSKAWRRLEDPRLVRRERAGNRSRLVLLNESGNGADYTHPADQDERYLKLPYAYWEGGWHLRLDLPGKVALLIALSLKDGFVLPADRGPDWYRISGDTVQRGLGELQHHGLIEVEERFVRAPLSETGWKPEHHYTLQAPFGPRHQTVATVTKLRA